MKVAVLMGSKTDHPLMNKCTKLLEQFDISVEENVISAHRNAQKLHDYITKNDSQIDVYIAGAGGAAHLPGVIASLTKKPVIGVPLKSKALEGIDSLLSIVQMPRGVPVLTVGIDQTINAAIAATQILSIKDNSLIEKISNYIDTEFNQI